MKRIKKKWILTILIVSTLLCACSDAPTISSVLGEGSKNFKEGKSEQDFALVSSGDLLNELMDKYSGSRANPTGTSLTEDESKIIQDKVTDDDSQRGVVEIASRDELKRELHEMFDETEEVLVFNSNNYAPNIDELGLLLSEIEREDMYDVICLNMYGIGYFGSVGTITLKYHLDVNVLKQMKDETRQLMQQAKAQIDVTNLSQYEIVCAVNDYLCDVIIYPEHEPYPAESHTAYSAFKLGSAVCDGYSRSAKLLLNEFGVECDFVVGECTNGGGHAWNLVKLDGEWYHMDVTWNDGAAEWDPEGRKEYLLVTDEFMKQSRTWDYSLYPKTPNTPY